jgi:hypothetical protein
VTTYYPSAKASLTIRFEDFGRDKPTPPEKSTLRLKGSKDERASLKVERDPMSPDGTTRFLLVSDEKTPPPKTDRGTSAGSDPWVGRVTHVIPLSATWKVTSPRTARTISLKFRYNDLPLDPRCIRSCAVEFFLGTVIPERHTAGVAGLTQAFLGGSDDTQLHIVPDQWVDPKGRIRSNLRFRGWTDEAKLSKSDGLPVVEMEFTDNSRLLAKQVAPPKLTISPTLPIDEAVAQYLAHFPQLAGLRVEYRPLNTRTIDNPPKLNKVLEGAAFRPELGPPPSKAGGATGADSSNSVWDYLTTVMGSFAHLAYVEETTAGPTLVLARGTSIVDKRVSARPDETYIPRTVDGFEYGVRTMVFGANVESLDVKRDFSKKESTNIEVRSYDSERKNVNVARFPEKADRVSHVLPDSGKTEQLWKVMKVPDNIRNAATLKALAEETYNALGRGEMQVTIKTHALSSFGGDNDDPDLLDLRNGDPIKLLSTVDGSTLGETEALFGAASTMEKAFLDRGFSPEFSSAYAKSYTDAAFQNLFRVSEVAYQWQDEDSPSLDITITAANYVEARVDRPTVTEEQVRGKVAPNQLTGSRRKPKK